MNRKDFLKTMSMVPFASSLNTLSCFTKNVLSMNPSPKMPILFFGHGSPMNAIELNEFSRTWRNLGDSLPQPTTILCISAHWETDGTYVTAMEKPKTIHDFGAFPKELFAVQYPAKGSPDIARLTKSTITSADAGLDLTWGLDHGCWSVLNHLYPDANIPVLQLSLDYRKPASYHFQLAKDLKSLRDKGVLIIGSGNMVHNLGILDWKLADRGFDWAIQANTQLKELINKGDFNSLVNYKALGKEMGLAIPTPEHYLPLLYILALKETNETVHYFNDKCLMGSISMTGLQIG